MTPLRQLLSLALDRPVEIERLQLSEEGGEAIEVVWARQPRAELPDRSLLPNEVLFTAGDLADAGAERIKNWLHLSEPFEPVLTRFFAARYAPGMYQEDLFHNLMEGVEAYHRRRCGDRPDEEAFRRMVETVLAAAPSAHVEWLEKQLEYSGEYRLSERIEGLLGLHPWMAGDVVPRNVRRWSRSIAAFRNQRAHEDPKEPARKSSIDRLMGYTQRLTVLLEACLLAEIGFDESRITEMIRRASEAYRIIKLNGL